MRDYPSELQQVFSDYRADLEACREKYKPTDGLLGLSRSMNDDVCHDRFDERVKTLSAEFASSRPSSETAARMIRMLLFPEDFSVFVILLIRCWCISRHHFTKSFLQFIALTGKSLILECNSLRFFAPSAGRTARWADCYNGILKLQ